MIKHACTHFVILTPKHFFKDNCIQNINCQNIGSLEELDLSKNQLTSVNGLDGCSNLRSLKLDGNKITRIGTTCHHYHLSLIPIIITIIMIITIINITIVVIIIMIINITTVINMIIMIMALLPWNIVHINAFIIGSYTSNKVMHLSLRNNQLITTKVRALKFLTNEVNYMVAFSIESTNIVPLSFLVCLQGVSQMKYIQTLDCSNNFLNHVEQLESCPLLRMVKLRGNNLQKVGISYCVSFY